jgi:hypothetical protein
MKGRTPRAKPIGSGSPYGLQIPPPLTRTTLSPPRGHSKALWDDPTLFQTIVFSRFVHPGLPQLLSALLSLTLDGTFVEAELGHWVRSHSLGWSVVGAI